MSTDAESKFMITIIMSLTSVLKLFCTLTRQFQGIGRLLYLELRERLQSVGVQTILCWGDKESEGFWVRQVN